MLPNILSAALAIAFSASGAVAAATTDAGLDRTVDRRLAGDRTGACLAVAVIDGDAVARSYRCADPGDASRIGPDAAFEIGSVAKTMTAALLADLIAQGKASLDDPLADYLPEGTAVPSYEGQPILLRHVVTHTSGLPALPSRMGTTDPADPYANLTEDALLASLGDVSLARAPGAQYEYSNFASMLLSYAVVRRAGSDFETLIDTTLFTPLGMDGAYIARRPDGVRAAAGHLPGGTETPAWTIAGNLAGVGGVRATLDDVVRYVQASLGQTDAPVLAALQATQQRVSEQPSMGMNWIMAPLDGRTVFVHEGGTGGFSSYVGFDPQRRRGVVVLSDTSVTSLGGLGDLGNHLLDDRLPLGKPRRVAQPPAELLDGLVGHWRLDTGMQVELAREGEALTIHPENQPVFELGYDDAGDFFPLAFDALLTPRRRADGSYVFVWHQGGGAIPATRIDAGAPAGANADAGAGTVDLADYAGNYPLLPGFALKVDAAGGRLRAQATGQGAFPLDAAGKDTFEAPAYGIEIRFQRGADGEVVSLDLHQGGRVLSGTRE
ncbi:serine hydrolase [Luteimonas sp. BDR2-5]|uniref:serine hydrolase n=1 Tax=Proluteimonas luteida TaxID=2878685 RepID=UPI001E4F4290|nr:serine hydrolase [Luteimonas sp. BDR2-5]MCD9028244.1 serine hydrolase [Luteimonas sp. BDR2-5]